MIFAERGLRYSLLYLSLSDKPATYKADVSVFRFPVCCFKVCHSLSEKSDR